MLGFYKQGFYFAKVFPAQKVCSRVDVVDANPVEKCSPLGVQCERMTAIAGDILLKDLPERKVSGLE